MNLVEYDSESGEGEKTVTVQCKRSMLKEGDYSSAIYITDYKQNRILSIPVTVTVPSQDPLSVALDNFVFTVAKHLYWENGNVIIELSIKNYKYLKVFQLDSATSYAIGDNGNNYSVSGVSTSIEANGTGVMKVTIHSVDESTTSFSEICLAIRDLSSPIVYSNVPLQ